MLFSNKNNALTVSISWLPVAAFIGAALAGMLVYFLSYIKRLFNFQARFDRNRIFDACPVADDIVYDKRTDIQNVPGERLDYRISIWLQLAGCERFIAGCACPLLISAAAARNVNIQTLGEELATGAGSSVQRNRFCSCF